MGKQTELFQAPPPDADDALNAAQAEMRRAQMARDSTRDDDVPLTREQRRSRRKRDVRPRTVSIKRMTKHEMNAGRALFPLDEHEDVRRPRVRGDCHRVARPCPFVSCVHHLYLDVSSRTGAIKLNFPDLDPDELVESCSLDIAERDGVTLEQTGAALNVTRERVRQMEVMALAKCQSALHTRAFRDVVDVAPGAGKRRLPMLSPSDEATFDAVLFASDDLDAE